MQDTELFEFITSLSVLERSAKPYAFIKRRRKLHVAPLVWTLLLAPLCQHSRSIADWYRLFCLTSGCASYRSGRASKQLLMQWIRDPNQGRARGRDPAVCTSRLADLT